MINSALQQNPSERREVAAQAICAQRLLAERWRQIMEDNPYYQARLASKIDPFLRAGKESSTLKHHLLEIVAAQQPKQLLVRYYDYAEWKPNAQRSISTCSPQFSGRYLRNKAMRGVLFKGYNLKFRQKVRELISDDARIEKPANKRRKLLGTETELEVGTDLAPSNRNWGSVCPHKTGLELCSCKTTSTEEKPSFMELSPNSKPEIPPWLKYCELSMVHTNYRMYQPPISSTVVTLAKELGVLVPKILKFMDYSRSSHEHSADKETAKVQGLSPHMKGGSGSFNSSYSGSDSSSRSKSGRNSTQLNTKQKLASDVVQTLMNSIMQPKSIGGSPKQPPRQISRVEDHPRKHSYNQSPISMGAVDQDYHEGPRTQRQTGGNSAKHKQANPTKKGQWSGENSLKRIVSQMEAKMNSEKADDVTEYGLQNESPKSRIKTTANTLKKALLGSSHNHFAQVISMRSSNNSSEVSRPDQKCQEESRGTPVPQKQQRQIGRIHPHSEAEVKANVVVVPRSHPHKGSSTQFTSVKTVSVQTEQHLVSHAQPAAAPGQSAYHQSNWKEKMQSATQQSKQFSSSSNTKPSHLLRAGTEPFEETRVKSQYSIQKPLVMLADKRGGRKHQTFDKHAKGCSPIRSGSKEFIQDSEGLNCLHESLVDSPASRKGAPEVANGAVNREVRHSEKSLDKSPQISGTGSPQLNKRILRLKENSKTGKAQKSHEFGSVQSLPFAESGSNSPLRGGQIRLSGVKPLGADWNQIKLIEHTRVPVLICAEDAEARETTRRSTQNNLFASDLRGGLKADLQQSYIETSRKHGSNATTQESPVRASLTTFSKPIQEQVDTTQKAMNDKIATGKVSRRLLHQPVEPRKDFDPDLERLWAAQERLQQLAQKRKPDVCKSKELLPRYVGDSFEGFTGVSSRVEETAFDSSPVNGKQSRVQGQTQKKASERLSKFIEASSPVNLRLPAPKQQPGLTSLHQSSVSSQIGDPQSSPAVNNSGRLMWNLEPEIIMVGNSVSQSDLFKRVTQSKDQFSNYSGESPNKVPMSLKEIDPTVQGYMPPRIPSLLVKSVLQPEPERFVESPMSYRSKQALVQPLPPRQQLQFASPGRAKNLPVSPEQRSSAHLQSKNSSAASGHWKSSGLNAHNGSQVSHGLQPSSKQSSGKQSVGQCVTPQGQQSPVKTLGKTVSNFQLSLLSSSPEITRLGTNRELLESPRGADVNLYGRSGFEPKLEAYWPPVGTSTKGKLF